MKKFTKGALIVTLVFVILGCVLCAVGAGIGFRYSSIPQMIRDGGFEIGSHFRNWGQNWKNWDHDFNHWGDWDDNSNSWSNGTTKEFDFSQEECSNIKNLNLDVDYGTVQIEETQENQGIHVEVKYRKSNTRRKINVAMEGNTLKVVEDSHKKIINNDNTRVTIQIPAGMNFTDVNLSNSAGEIILNREISAENLSITVGAGTCQTDAKLTAAKKLYAEAGVGEIELSQVEAGKMELKTGVGAIDVERAAADEMILNSGVGSIEVMAEGTESDYNYRISCGIGEVEIGESTYSGLGSTKEVRGQGNKTIDIDCGVGEVSVEFEY